MTQAAIQALATRLGEALMRRNWRLVTAESCTGGWISKSVTDIAGSSDWFDRGFVTYSNAAKTEMLGVKPDLIETQGAVSEAVVRAMATGALARSTGHCSVAVSGVAGPSGGTADKPVGLVWLAWASGRGDAVMTAHYVFPGDRESVRENAVRQALEGLLRLTGNA